MDWSFIDAAYLITCPKPDGTNPRLETAWKQLQAVGLDSKTEVCEFGTDDDDRIRGCYTSHISVLESAEKRFADRDASQPLNILVLEDDLSVSPRVSQETLDSIAGFMRSPQQQPDMVHLAYIMYVPGLSTERLSDEEHIVRLKCNADSVLGTTAYIISRGGLDALLAEHRRTGYVDGGAIPNVMARLFPESRYAAFPMPLHRAATIKSLVNGQLDTLRALIFQPQVYTQWERLLVGTGLSTNVLFPSMCVAMIFLLGALASLSEAVSSISAIVRGEDVSMSAGARRPALFLPIASSLLSIGCLAVLAYGLSLAPKPETQKIAEEQAAAAAAAAASRS